MQQYTIYLYLQTALHVSGGISTHHQGAHITVSTVSGIIEIVAATCCERDWMGTGLGVQFICT